MAQRRFGPTRGAGVAIIELEGDKSIQPAALGFAGYAGIFEKGPVGELIVITNKTQFNKMMGSWYEGSLAPDVAIDYYDVAAGAGGLCLVRVTDGNELQAQATLYGRFKDQLAPVGTIKAKNGGRWGGKLAHATGNVASGASIANTSLTTGNATWKTDQWKGGYIELDSVTNKRYPIIGNSAAGVIQIATDQTMKADWTAAASLSNFRYYLTLEQEGKAVSYLIGDGEENPDTEFCLTTYVDGAFVKKYPNLSPDPASGRYWINMINNDGANDEIEVEDLWTGSQTASVRPANRYGNIASVTTTVLTATIADFLINSAAGTPTLALGTTTDADLPQIITVTMTSATVGTAVSDKFGALGTLTLGSLFDPHNAAGGALKNKWAPPMTVTAGTALAVSDTLVITYKPFLPSSLIGGFLYPDKVNSKREKYRITANNHKTITVAVGSNLTTSGAASDAFMVEAPQELRNGRDGIADLGDADYIQKAWDVNTSPFNRIFGKNLGLVKMATPGITSTAVQQAGKAYAEAKNYQYRYEGPDTLATENDVIAYANDTLGRSDYAVIGFPSYGWCPDPLGNNEGKLKLVPLTGQIHGREARIAADFDGYHKAGAGIDATLPKVLKITIGDAALDEEQLNPVGIAVIKKKNGNFIIWGDRTLNLDPNWKFKHQRELMSHYEHTLQENFDWIVFAINDPDTESLALVALQTYFLPEWQKRALRGAKFTDAAIIKVDEEINTDATRSAGDMYAEISLQLADTVERFIIKIGKQGIFDNVAP